MKKLLALCDRRDRIIFDEPYAPEKYQQMGLRYFDCLRRHELRMLLDRKIFSLYPWRKYMEYYWFLETYGSDDSFFLHGFTYSAERSLDDSGRIQWCCGIVPEGIGRTKKFRDDESEAKRVFKFLFGDANQFRWNLPWAWYD